MLTPQTIRSTAIGFAAALMLACAVGAASARNLSVSNQNIRATWASMEFGSPSGTVRCSITLEGSFHTRTIAKVARSLAGAVTRAMFAAAGCTGGTGAAFNGTERHNGTTSPNTLPWHLTYESFTGTLPNISSLQLGLSRFRFGFTVGGEFGCTGQTGSETDVITASATREAAGAITAIAPVAGRNTVTVIREDRDPFNTCPTSGNMAGTSTTLTVLNAATRITITLI